MANDLSLRSTALRLLCWVQGSYFLLTGVWPLLSIGTFELITGPKTDDWLVHTVGGLVIVVAAVLLRAAFAGRASLDTLIAGAGSAFVLMNIDLIYASRGVISRVYLWDGGVELVFLGVWAWCAPAVFGEEKS